MRFRSNDNKKDKKCQDLVTCRTFGLFLNYKLTLKRHKIEESGKKRRVLLSNPLLKKLYLRRKKGFK